MPVELDFWAERLKRDSQGRSVTLEIDSDASIKVHRAKYSVFENQSYNV